MMMPRLKVIQQILSNDGVVFISIDDVEVTHLRSLMNDVFGEHNFLAQLVWEKSRKNDAKFFSLGHEYILVYARSLETLKAKKTVWREEKPGAAEILQFYQLLRKQHGTDDLAIEEELRNWYRELPKNHPSKKLSRYKQVDKWGPWRDRDISWPGGNGPRYLLFHPLTNQPCAIPNSGWRFSEAEMHRQIAIGLVVFRDDHTEPPMRKRHLVVVPEEFEDDGESEVEDDDDPKEDDAVGEEDMVGLQVMPSVIYKQSQVSVKQLRRIMGKKAFNNPKDPDVLARLIRYTTSDGDIILDCTAGSGTTAHAVLQINSEEENNRRFILTQQKHDSKEDEKKQNNICQDITRERVKRVIEGKNTEALGGSFTYARLSETPVLGINRDLDPLPSYEDLARTVFYTHTSQSADETKWNRESGFLGERNGEAIFLLYDPHADIELGLERAWLDAWGQSDPRFHLVVYSEKFAIHRDDLREWCEKHGKTVTHLLVPYEIK